MKKYKVLITRWKSEIVNAEGIDNYSAVLHGWGIKEGWCVFGIKEGGAE